MSTHVADPWAPAMASADTPGTDQRVVVVTGAAGGIGGAVARRLAGPGTAVVTVDRHDSSHTLAAVRAAGACALGLTCDVSAPEAVRGAVSQVVERFARIDVLVNCAGITDDHLLLTMDEQEWDRVVDVNLCGAMRWSLAVAPSMRRHRGGRIINFSSVAAEGSAGQTNYATAKAAVAGFTQSLAAELGPYGVTVNAVAPGFVATAMVDDLARRLGVERDTFLDRAAEQAALRRVGSACDIAGVVAFLAGPESGYLTGQAIVVDGGRR